MLFSFNLIDQPWIPVVTYHGDLVEVSLKDLFEYAHEIREISCETPIMTASIMPIALAILHRVFGPEDEYAWGKLWGEGRFLMQPIMDYLEEWYDRFDLFHAEYPFYQVYDGRVKEKSVIHLIHSIGNTGTLFVHENDANGIELDPSQAVRHLITSQYFRTAGLSGLKEKFTDGIFTRGVLFWVDGEILFEKLMLNLVAYPSDVVMPHTSEDKPSWEHTNIFHERTVPYGYLDYLTWANNRVLFLPENNNDKVIVSKMMIAPGLHIDANVFSPQKRYERFEKNDEVKYSFLYFNSNKAMWQNYHTLLELSSNNIRPPIVITWLSDLAWNDILDENYQPNLIATGMLADQAKPIFYRQEIMPLPLQFLRDTSKIQWIAKAIEDAEAVDRIIFDSIKELANHVLMRGADGQPDSENRKQLMAQWNALQQYWLSLEPFFWNFVDELLENEVAAIAQWRDILRQTADQTLVYTQQLAGKEPWTLNGGIIATRKLYAGLNKL